MFELPVRFVDLRLGLQIERMLGDVEVGVAAEPRQGNLRLLLQRREPLLRGIEAEVRLVVSCARVYSLRTSTALRS